MCPLLCLKQTFPLPIYLEQQDGHILLKKKRQSRYARQRADVGPAPIFRLQCLSCMWPEPPCPPASAQPCMLHFLAALEQSLVSTKSLLCSALFSSRVSLEYQPKRALLPLSLSLASLPVSWQGMSVTPGNHLLCHTEPCILHTANDV